MTPIELKEIRESFDFSQKQMGAVLGVHQNALQRMEYGTSPIPKYIKHYALSLSALNENRLFIKHIKIIEVDL